MKKLTLLLFAFLLTSLSWHGQAQLIDVGIDGYSATDMTNRFPLGNHEGYERSASIYRSNQIGVNGIISSIAWYAETEGKGPRPIKIYLNTTGFTEYGTLLSLINPPGQWANRIADATLVYEGNITPVEGWNTIILATPFVYGSGNLEVMVEANYGGSGNGGGEEGNVIRHDNFTIGNFTPHAQWQSNTSPPTTSGAIKPHRPKLQLGFIDRETITVADGFNFDVIAEGTGSLASKTSTNFDAGGRVLYSEDYRRALVDLNLPPRGLPEDRILPNLLAEGPSMYKLQNYSTNNVLQLLNTTARTLNFENPKPLRELYLLHASGNGPTNLTGTLNFGDGSTQPIAPFVSNDWVTGPLSDVAYKGYGRADASGLLGANEYYRSDDDNSTKFYQTAITVDMENLHKTIVGITLTRTDNQTSGSFNLMALAGKEAPKYIYQNTAWINNNDPSGIATALDDILVISGIATLSANTNVNNLTINSGATLEIDHVLNLHGNITNDGDLVFLSTATSNGELGPVPSTSVITGEATVHRYMSANRAYRMVSSAVTTTSTINTNWQEGVNNADTNTNLDPNPGFGTHITGNDASKGFDITQTGNPSLYSVNVATQAFEVVPNTNVETLNAGEGYLMMVRGDRSIDLNNQIYSPTPTILRAKGQLAVGDITQDFTVPAPSPPATEAYVLFGNPYQSAVNMQTVLQNSTNVSSNYYIVYDPTVASGQGAYITVNVNDNTNNLPGGSEANQYLQAGQAAQVASVNSGVVEVKFKESYKAPGQHTQTHATGNTTNFDDVLTVQIFTQENFINGNKPHDGFVMLFSAENNNDVTSMDAVKPMNFYENLGRNHNETYLSIEQREMPQAEEVYQLYSTGYSHSEYSLNLMVDGLEDTLLYLEDHFTGSSTPLEAGATVYNFSVDANNELSKTTDRFSIRTEARLGVEDNSVLAGVRLFPNPLNDNTFYINAPKLDGETVSITVNDMLGREIAKTQQTFSGSTVKIDLSQDLKSGIYMVTISSNGTDKTLRIIKR